METIIKKHLDQIQLNEELRLFVEEEGWKAIGEITDLLNKGADPNYRPEYGDSLICSVLYEWPADAQATGIELLTRFGANVNLYYGDGVETALSICLGRNSPVEIQNLLLSKGAVPIQFSREDFESSEVACRFGRANPEKAIDAYHTYMIATGKEAYALGKSGFRYLVESGKIEDFEELTSEVKAGNLSAERGVGLFNYKTHGVPKWCSNRYGSSYHFLEDGTMIQIGGEYEDFYDPQFNIYNDVIRIAPNGAVDLFLYPERIFPPTDFHSSTKVGNHIIIIGGLGYQQDRVTGQTNMYVLNLASFSIKSIRSKGDNPGWLFKHTTLLDEQHNCLYLMDGEKWINGKIVENKDIYRFDLKHRRWRLQ